MAKRELGTKAASELLIRELYVELRERVNAWAAVTQQTAQARMGYIGQHLVSVITGHPGSRSGARGYDLVLPGNRYAEIKTCYRVDQLGRCESCGKVVASIETKCPHCRSGMIRRNDDSKWLIGIRNDAELDYILTPASYYLVLFEFADIVQSTDIIATVWQVNPLSPGFALCLVDYYLNIRAKSTSKAPFNLWPYSPKFYMMCPSRIYRSRIMQSGEIETQEFGGSILEPMGPISNFPRARTITNESLQATLERLGKTPPKKASRKALMAEVDAYRRSNSYREEDFRVQLAITTYRPLLEAKIQTGALAGLSELQNRLGEVLDTHSVGEWLREQ